MPELRAELLLIGSELTEGRLADRNGHFLAGALSDLGVEVERIVLLPDEPKVLRSAMEAAIAGGAEIILSSGGLGHTSDDLTAALWAEVLGDELTLSQALLDSLAERLRQRGRPGLPFLERYALVPRRGGYFANPVGLAPALWWELLGRFICALPGPPAELQALWKAHLLPLLQERFQPKPPHQHTLRTTGLTESALSARLQAWEAQLPAGFRLAYNPSWEGVSLHLRAPATVPETIFTAQVEALRAAIGPYLYAEGSASLAAALLNLLEARNLTVAVTESCTGGHIAAALVEVPGASATFLGGIVAYANSTKVNLLGVDPTTLTEHGAVSEAVARQMAEGVRQALGAQIGIATTGIAGPTGATPNKPIGTVWIGIALPEITVARHFVFPGDRNAVIQRATAFALSLTWQALTGLLLPA